MLKLRFLANMNISPKTVDALNRQAWDIVRVSNLLPVDTPDHRILEYARQEDRIIVTQDLDFSTLLAVGGHTHPSLITLRLSVSDPETITRRLVAVLPRIEDALLRGCAVTIEDAAVRIRYLPIG